MHTTMATENNNKNLNVPNLRFPEFSGEWKKTYIGECFSKVENGLTYDTNNTSGVPVTRIETISDKSINYDRVGYASVDDKISKYRMQYGDILFSHINSLKHIGKTAFYNATQPLYHGMNLLLLRSKKSLDSKFLYYTLNTYRFLHRCQVLANQAVNQASINTKELKSVNISVPQMLEQRKIAEFISLLDERIDTQIKIIEKLESLIKGLYERLFNIDSAAYIQLGNVAKIQKGQQINGEELSEIGSYYVMNGGVVPSGYLEDFNTPANTISISEGGNSCGYVQYNGVPFWSGGHCYTLIEPINSFNYKYLFHYLKFKEQSIMALRIGSGLPNIQKKDLERFPILNVSKEEQDKMACIFDDILDRIICERQIALKYEEQKKYLLSNLFI